jgi:hypothetical protein
MSLLSVEHSVATTSKDLTIRFVDTMVTASGIAAAISIVSYIQSWFVEGGFLHRFQASGPGVAALVTTVISIALGFWRVRLLPPTPAPEEKQEKAVTIATTNSLLLSKHPEKY